MRLPLTLIRFQPVGGTLKHKTATMGVYLLLCVGAFFVFKAVPSGFVPAQDKQYLVGFAQLPDAASLDRTDAVIRRMSDIAKSVPGVEKGDIGDTACAVAD